MASITHITRRLLLGASASACGLVAAGRFASAQEGLLKPTPRCDDGPTRRQTEGPFFRPSSPHRRMLREPGGQGAPLRLTGLVVTRSCKPVAGALVDLWHTDAAGASDNAGFTFRGHQFTDSDGFWSFETIAPGLYPGRTRHFHVKFQAPGGRVLTTQLYFPGEPGNARDGLYAPALLLSMRAQDSSQATFVAVLDVA
ncbi:MAG: intradiol ring-cleavage dioxygenase [Beijerinckiaceae bacterium]|nr:intradiol ring-cleavage dioxygenase [Beijerinckiaceae bacterium]